MGALKSKLAQCNDNADEAARANCQIVAYEEALGLVRGLLAVCNSNETCKAKVMRAVGKLEVLKSNAENASRQDTPPAPTELPDFPENPAAEPQMPGAVPAGAAAASPMMSPQPPQQSIPIVPTQPNPMPAAGMVPPMMPPMDPSQAPVPGQEYPQEPTYQEFYDLSSDYNKMKSLR